MRHIVGTQINTDKSFILVCRADKDPDGLRMKSWDDLPKAINSDAQGVRFSMHEIFNKAMTEPEVGRSEVPVAHIL